MPAIDHDFFANFLSNIFASSDPRAARFARDLIEDIPRFSIDELVDAMSKMSNLKCADEHGLIIEMMKMVCPQPHRRLLDAFNHCLDDYEFENK